MAFPAETVTTSKVGLSHVFLMVNGTGNSSNSPYKKKIGRVASVGGINLANELYKHRGKNASGISQIVKAFVTALGDGEVTVTLDEIYDWDIAGETYWGEQLDVQLQGFYQDAPTKGWSFIAAKAYVNPGANFQPNIDTPSTCDIVITPYNTAGTAPWSFNDDVTV